MSILKKIIDFIKTHSYAWILSYFFVYMIWFTYLERTVTKVFHPIHSRLDDFIPFQEIFIIPYFLWFLYIAVTVAYFLLTSKQDFIKCCTYLFTGMTICLIIYTVWPNGHHLRVDLNSLGRSNIFITMLSKIYAMDTPTNVFPSIHVFNSVGALIAINRSEKLHNIKWLHLGAFVLTVLICMSTVFLKQHSFLDILGALVLNIILYVIIYAPSASKDTEKAKQELTKVS